MAARTKRAPAKPKPEQAEAVSADEPVEPKDKYTRAGGHVLTDKGWVLEKK